MVILIDSTADSAKRVVTVGHRVGNREFLQSRCTCRLDDAHVCDVVAHHGVETDAHFCPFRSVGVVGAENLVGDGVLAGFLRSGKSVRFGDNSSTVYEVYTFVK